MLVCLPFFSLQAQDSLFRLRFHLPGSFNAIAADKGGRLYAATAQSAIYQYSPEGKILFRYNDNNLGPVSLLDATDPMQLLVFSGDFQQALTLDRTLNPTASVALYDYGLAQVQAICMSNRNTLWVFDPTDGHLKNLGPDGGFARESPDLRVAVRADFNPTFLVESENRLFVQDIEQPIAVLDLSGNYLFALGFPTSVALNVSEGTLFLAKEKKLYGWNLKTLQQAQWPMPNCAGETLQICVGPGYLYLRTSEGIWAFDRK